MNELDYQVVWAPFGPDSEVGRRAGADRPILLPYFLDGEALELRRQGKGVALDDFDLLRGILVAFLDDPPEAEPGELRPYLRCALEELVGAFRRPSLEATILEGALHLARTHGWRVGRHALRSGAALAPGSARIRCDLVVALWRSLESGDEPDRTGAAQEILAEAGAIDQTRLPGRPAQFLFLIELGALGVLGRGREWAARLGDAVHRPKLDPDLEAKLSQLLATQGDVDPAAWGLVSGPDEG